MTDVKITALDRLISKVSPKIALNRVKNRNQFDALAGGGYNAGSKSRDSMAGWRVRANDADTDTLNDLITLRARSRDIIRNNPIGSGAVNVKVKHVVGTGLKPNPSIDREFLGLPDDIADQWEMDAEREFKHWADSQDSDIERVLTFSGSQDLAYRASLENGDHFVIMTAHGRRNSLFDMSLQHIEADRVCNESHQGDTDTLSGGVQRDSNNAPSAIHILKGHPGSIRGRDRDWDIVPVFGANTGRRVVLHLFRKLRAGQNRGVPDLAPVMEHIKQLGRYTEAEIDAAVKQAFWAMAVHTETGEGLAGLNIDQWRETRKEFYTDSPINLKGGSSLVAGLFPDDKIDFLDPSRPNTAFDPFINAMFTQLGMGLELPKEVLMESFQSSFSAARGSLLQSIKFFMGRRKWLATTFCQPIYETVISESIAKGRLSAPGFFSDPAIFSAYTGSEWIGDEHGQIDENKAVTAAIDRINAGLSTQKRETAALTGQDWEKVKRQREKELRQDINSNQLNADESRSINMPTADDLDAADAKEVFDAKGY